MDAGIGIVDKENSGMRLKVEGIKGTGDGARSAPQTYGRARGIQASEVSTDGKEVKMEEVAKDCWELSLAVLDDMDRRGVRPTRSCYVTAMMTLEKASQWRPLLSLLIKVSSQSIPRRSIVTSFRLGHTSVRMS